MSSKYQDVSDVPTETLCKRLAELAHAVTISDRRMMREFTMRIPAEVDRDADIVISEAARRLTEANATIEAVRGLPRYEVWADKYGNLNWKPDKDGYWMRPHELDKALEKQE